MDSQYLFSNTFINNLIGKKRNIPDIKIEVFSNDNYHNNVFKNENVFMNFMSGIKNNSLNILNQHMITKLKNEKIAVKTPLENKYTHNKLFIFDGKYILVGSMNIMDKSLQSSGGDIELCVLIKNRKLANEMLEYYKNILF